MSAQSNTAFRSIHERGKPFILANAWDAGSARMLESLGAQAIGTSSAAHAFTLGRPDMGLVSRDEALAHAEQLVAAVKIPVSGDFENGFGEDPEVCAETVRFAFEAGLAGISVEDTALPDAKPYARELAIERIRAAVAAARALPGDFMLVARADGVMNAQYDLDEAMARLQGYEQAGADCLYIPLPGGMAEQERVCKSTTLPVNALAAGPFTSVSHKDFAKIGVARISLGSALARVTHRAIHDAAIGIFEHGDFSTLGNGISGAEVDQLLTGC